MYLKSFAAFLCLAHWTGLSSARHHRHGRRQAESTEPYVYTGPMVPSYNFSMPVDHFNKSDNRVYNNRYWVNDTYYKAGGPVFFYDQGESGATEQGVAQTLAEVDTISAVMRLAEKYNGVAVHWEHRYYGLSFPIPLNMSTHEPETGIAGYEYLSVEQALEDVVYFANNWKMDNCSGDACAATLPSKTPWIWLGGSYPGVRGALLRVRNPEVFYAVWSSSAPVEAVVDGSAYFAPAQSSLPANCSNDVEAAVKYADEVMSGEHGIAAYLELQQLAYVADQTQNGLNQTYDLAASAAYSPFQIADFMSNIFKSDFQYVGPASTTHLFCNYLEDYHPNGNSSIQDDSAISVLSNPGGGTTTWTGIARMYGPPVALDALFYATRRFLEQKYLDSQGSTGSEKSPDPTADAFTWAYQFLTEFGWFQGSNPDNVTVVSKFANIVTQRDTAIGGFTSNATSADFPELPDVDAFNKYGGWDMKPSNVMFTDGDLDPWRGGTVMVDMPWNDAPVRNVVQTVPQCNVPPSGDDVFGLVFTNAEHCPDLTQSASLPYNETSPVYNAVTLFGKALDVWLPCFKSS